VRQQLSVEQNTAVDVIRRGYAIVAGLMQLSFTAHSELSQFGSNKGSNGQFFTRLPGTKGL